jgi:hypothetical protein
VSLVVGNAAALAALAGQGPVLAALLSIWLVDTTSRAARLCWSRSVPTGA